MKKILLFFATVCVLLVAVSCENDAKYTIKGSASGYPDGTKVYLQMRDKPDWVNVDSTTIVKGRFLMVGQVAPGFLGYISIGEDRSMVVVEPGEIRISIENGQGYPHGTECNERLTEFCHSMEIVDEEIADVMARMEAVDVEDTATRVRFMARLEELDGMGYKLLAQVIEKNITNPLGVGMLCFYNSAFADDVDFLVSLSKQIPEDFKQQSYVAKVLDNVKIIESTSAGKRFVDLKMKTKEGNVVSLKSLVESNKYVLIDFWASWCAPCRQSLPGIRQLYLNYKDKGLCIVGVSLDEDKKAWEMALGKFGMEWLQVGEMLGWDSEHAAKYGVRAIPATVLIDSTGTIVGRNLESGEIAKILDSCPSLSEGE